MKNVLITGASRGIGKCCAERFAYEGYNVIINYNESKEKAEDLLRFILENNGSAMAVKCDISDAGEVDRMMSAIEKRFGGVDILVNNAGIANIKMFSDFTEAEWDRMFDINVKGAFLVTQRVVPYMIHKKSGKIINITSMWGEVGASCEVCYSATKAALIGMTKALSKELGPSGITVNAVSPGLIVTDMNAELTEEEIKDFCGDTPLMRVGYPNEIADSVLFLASHSADFITGQVLSVNGGVC